MAAHQYMAIMRALAFKRSNRTPSVRGFLAELSGTHRHGVLKDWGLLWAALAAAILVVVFAAHFHRSPLPAVPADDGFADGKLRTGERKCDE